MRRREVIARFAGVAAAWPLVARAQQPSGRPLVGVLSPLSPAAGARSIDALRQGLRELGHVDGQTIALELRFADGAPERLSGLAVELLAARSAVMVVGGLGAVAAAQTATRSAQSTAWRGQRATLRG
ncbi:MAG: hypothetical protein HY060_17800 [Proteobacteria bacterium]|nr:hypothetical protein [Pseudomonadota bacterium]